MLFDIFTLFPEYFVGPLSCSMLRRGREAGALGIEIHDIRSYTEDRHHVCDDAPYGGGAGMVMKAEPVAAAIEDVLKFSAGAPAPCAVIHMSPQGRPFSQQIAQELSGHDRIALLCGHYEGIDERAIEAVVTDEISIGDYILTGGEAAAVVVIDAVARLVPGVLGNADSALGDSYSHGLLEAAHYTRPPQWRGRDVPEVLMSGHHGEIQKWRFRQGLRRTLVRRPDLLQGRIWSASEQKIVDELVRELESREAAPEEKSDGSEFTASG
jgi:tRNA (guanine37-N1)-methyltransferase